MPQALQPEADTRQLDFWLGHWRAEWDNPEGTTGTGESRVTRDAVGGHAICQRFSAPGLKGVSTTSRHAPFGLWRQTWVDNTGGFYSLIGGPGGEADDYDFVPHQARLSKSAPFSCMIWQDVTGNSFTWRWQGRHSVMNDWADRWVIRYARAAE